MLNFEIQHNQNNVIYHNLSREHCDKSQENIIVSEIGSKIKEVREARGFTLQELAALAGEMNHGTLSKIENGINNPSKRTLIAIAKALNDNFGESWLDGHLTQNDSAPSRKEIIKDMSAKEFISLKFGGRNPRRSKTDLDMLTKLLDAEIERMEKENE